MLAFAMDIDTMVVFQDVEQTQQMVYQHLIDAMMEYSVSTLIHAFSITNHHLSIEKNILNIGLSVKVLNFYNDIHVTYPMSFVPLDALDLVPSPIQCQMIHVMKLHVFYLSLE